MSGDGKAQEATITVGEVGGDLYAGSNGRGGKVLNVDPGSDGSLGSDANRRPFPGQSIGDGNGCRFHPGNQPRRPQHGQAAAADGKRRISVGDDVLKMSPVTLYVSPVIGHGRSGRSANDGDEVTLLDDITGGNGNFAHGAGLLHEDGNFHLHGLQDDQSVAHGDFGADLDQNRVHLRHHLGADFHVRS
jgi:hypothetical protein